MVLRFGVDINIGYGRGVLVWLSAQPLQLVNVLGNALPASEVCSRDRVLRISEHMRRLGSMPRLLAATKLNNFTASAEIHTPPCI